MIKSLTEIIKDVALRHKGVNTCRYQLPSQNNAQHNYEPFQVYIDSVSHHRLNITTNIFLSEFEIYILGTIDEENSVVDVQDSAFTIAVDIVGYIDTKAEFQNILSVYDYDIITLQDYSAQRNAGVRLSLVLHTPNPLNLCTLDDNFGERKDDEEEEDLDIVTIDLPISTKC